MRCRKSTCVIGVRFDVVRFDCCSVIDSVGILKVLGGVDSCFRRNDIDEEYEHGYSNHDT